jgi:hypothetical protein
MQRCIVARFRAALHAFRSHAPPWLCAGAYAGLTLQAVWTDPAAAAFYAVLFVAALLRLLPADDGKGRALASGAPGLVMFRCVSVRPPAPSFTTRARSSKESAL